MATKSWGRSRKWATASPTVARTGGATIGSSDGCSILGALAQITARSHKPAGEDWLWKMLQRKPVKLVAIALANRMARTVWALLRTGESYRAMPG